MNPPHTKDADSLDFEVAARPRLMKFQKNYIVWGEIHFVATCGGGSNQFQGIRMVTSSLPTTEQKFLRLRGRVVSTVVNALSLLNWRNWLGGKFPVDIHKVREILLP